MALKTGSDLVPVFTFGENELFATELIALEAPVDTLYKMNQDLPEKWRSLSYWRRIFYEITMHSLYMLKVFITPWKRVPLTTVVGKPIEIKSKIEDPSDEQIKELHQIYIDELQKLFHENKEIYLRNKNVTFEII